MVNIKLFISNVFSSTEGVFTNVWIDADEVRGQGDDDPEELLAHADDAADPGEESQGGDVELRPRLLHLTVEVNKQTVSVLLELQKIHRFSRSRRRPLLQGVQQNCLHLVSSIFLSKSNPILTSRVSFEN